MDVKTANLEIRKQFSERLQKLVLSAFKTHKKTHTAICLETGVQFSSMSDYISGKKLPNVFTLIKLAEYFGVSVDYLLGLDDT